MSENIQIAFNITRGEQIELENICTEEGKSFHDYFMGMHKEHMGDLRKFSKSDLDKAVKDALSKSKSQNDEIAEEDLDEEQPLDVEEEPVYVSPKKKGRPKKDY